MKFSWKWLNQLIDLKNISLNQIIYKLTLAGFEIEDIINIEKTNDRILDISITANRMDAESMVGLARELSTIFDLDTLYTLNNYCSINTRVNKKTTSRKINLSSFSHNHLLDIQFQVIDNIRIRKTPKWLENYLIGCDIVPNNILTDITQYINIKWGQHIEIFDTNKIDNQGLKTDLLEITKVHNLHKYISSDDTINIQGLIYKQTPISVFGSEFNSDFSCDNNTFSILIMGYICHPIYLNTIVDKLNKKTGQLQKRKKVISRHDFLSAYKEVINLVHNLNCIESKFVSDYEWHEKINTSKTITISKTEINHTLGPVAKSKKHLTNQEIIKILDSLKLNPMYQENNFIVKIPEYRKSDITRPIDVIEEIGRIYGFNHFIDILPSNYKKGKISNLAIFLKKVRNSLRSLGLHEVTHYSLDNLSQNKSSITLHNPLQEDQTHLRQSLIYHLLNTIKYNEQQKNSILECFEIGRVFNKKLLEDNTYNYTENIYIAGILGRNEFSKNLWSNKGQELSWFQAKGLIETLLEELHSSTVWKASAKDSIWLNISHPYRYAVLQNKQTNKKVGIFSELNFNSSKTLSKHHHIYIFELNLLELMKTVKKPQHLSYTYQKYSPYPSVTRDISLILDRRISSTVVKEFILHQNNKFIESIEILNEYTNDNHSRSISFRIAYRSNTKTLNDKDVQRIDKDINILLNKFNQKKANFFLE
uniref:phenylalanine--tRNA ligase n=1 Tax=Caulacanthus okamurae TaxID=152008 RepID=A0A6H1U6Y7_9FLOR|nr:phenylalanine tRNA synthetase [Caulacanthus okamurae]QIZ74611.1 phenylalanine tRNA synthetase [Caulacanthus okamurae]